MADQKLCVYTVDHDTNYAPNVSYGVCRLKGCKKRTIEKSARPGDWIIGIGGTRTGKERGLKGKFDRKIIYAMKVQENLGDEPKSKDFYYFGDKAIDLPKNLRILVPHERRFRQKYFRLKEHKETINKFEKFIRKQPSGRIGKPCDLESTKCRG
jgi:hypothetical protein